MRNSYEIQWIASDASFRPNQLRCFIEEICREIFALLSWEGGFELIK